jgi:hypothetical protein
MNRPIVRDVTRSNKESGMDIMTESPTAVATPHLDTRAPGRPDTG